MSLWPGKSEEAIGHNIDRERDRGAPLEKATAIALHKAHIAPQNGGEIKAGNILVSDEDY